MTGVLTVEKMQELAEVYDSKFGNLDEVLHPSIMTRPAFLSLLETAIQRGTPLTREEVDQVFPGVSWEE